MPDGDRDAARETDAYPAEKARQGRIVLDTPVRRAVFVAGLAGLFLLAPALVVL